MGLEIELTREEENEVMWSGLAHFKRLRDVVRRKNMRSVARAVGGLKCEECQDFIMGACAGQELTGWQCLECMYRMVSEWGWERDEHEILNG
jgi:hypothetical protein